MLDRKTWWPKVLRGKKACDPDRERRDLAANRRAVVIDNDDGPDEDEEDDDV